MELPVAVQEDTPAVEEGPDAGLNGAPAGDDGDVPMSASVCMIGGRQVCAVMEEYESMIAAADVAATVCGLLEVTGKAGSRALFPRASPSMATRAVWSCLVRPLERDANGRVG